MPAALTADMWTHVYVQQANSVFAGHTSGEDEGRDEHPPLRHHGLHYAHEQQAARLGSGCSGCGGGGGGHKHKHKHKHSLGDTPSGEDQGAK